MLIDFHQCVTMSTYPVIFSSTLFNSLLNYYCGGLLDLSGLLNCCWINVYFVSSMTTMAVKNGLKISD